MSLSGTLQIGKTALASTQAAIQTVGNNIAGASDPNYTRQVADIQAKPGQKLGPGLILGTGVDLTGVARQIDEALTGRLRNGVADAAGSRANSGWLDQIEGVFNELGDADLSTQFSTFFAAWSDAANKPTDVALRQNVLTEGESLATKLRDTRGGLEDLTGAAGDQLQAFADSADDLSRQIAGLNDQIVRAEGGANAAANGLRDRRDALLGDLAELVNITTKPQDDGGVNVYVGSEPLVVGDTSHGVRLNKSDNANGEATYQLVFADNGTPLGARSGKLGGTASAFRQMTNARDGLDALAGGLIFELNKLHSTGQGLVGYDDLTSSNRVADPAAALNSDAAGLAFSPTNGSFVINVRDKITGDATPTLIDVAGGKTLAELAADLNAVGGVTADVYDGRLRVGADSPGQDLTFADDTSGVLAALGVGGFFTGTNAADVKVSAALDDPRRLAVSRNGEPGDNATATKIADLQDAGLSSFGGGSITQSYQALVYDVASTASAARNDADAAASVQETLSAQRQALSGVSLDEEAVTLLRYQRSYQGAARLIAAVDEMFQTILQLV